MTCSTSLLSEAQKCRQDLSPDRATNFSLPTVDRYSSNLSRGDFLRRADWSERLVDHPEEFRNVERLRQVSARARGK